MYDNPNKKDFPSFFPSLSPFFPLAFLPSHYPSLPSFLFSVSFIFVGIREMYEKGRTNSLLPCVRLVARDGTSPLVPSVDQSNGRSPVQTDYAYTCPNVTTTSNRRLNL